MPRLTELGGELKGGLNSRFDFKVAMTLYKLFKFKRKHRSSLDHPKICAKFDVRVFLRYCIYKESSPAAQQT